MAGRIKHILFVCTGNTCRSPFAEGLLKKYIQKKGLDDVVSDSAGLLSLSGSSASSLAQKVASEYHVDLSGHLAKSVGEDIINRSDLVLVMEQAQANSILEEFPDAADKVFLIRHFARFGSKSRGIADPYGLNYEAYRFCFLDIQDCVSGLAGYLSDSSFVFEPVQVNCYEGYKANESPRSFALKGSTLKIKKIIDRWREGGLDNKSDVKDYYKVEADDGNIYIVRYNRISEYWSVKTTVI